MKGTPPDYHFVC